MNFTSFNSGRLSYIKNAIHKLAKNKLAGKRSGTSKTAKHYAKNAKSRAKNC